MGFKVYASTSHQCLDKQQADGYARNVFINTFLAQLSRRRSHDGDPNRCFYSMTPFVVLNVTFLGI